MHMYQCYHLISCFLLHGDGDGAWNYVTNGFLLCPVCVDYVWPVRVWARQIPVSLSIWNFSIPFQIILHCTKLRSIFEHRFTFAIQSQSTPCITELYLVIVALSLSLCFLAIFLCEMQNALHTSFAMHHSILLLIKSHTQTQLSQCSPWLCVFV